MTSTTPVDASASEISNAKASGEPQAFAAGGSVRFRPPRVRTHLLPREHLLRQLIDACVLPLTTVVSGAGYGKTTLLAQFAAAREADGGSIAWVSLTDADRDGLYFLQSMIRSFRRLGRRIGESVLAPLQSGEESALDAAVDGLLDAVTCADHMTTLVLDDFHLAESEATCRIIAALARGAPRAFSVVLSSRSVPSLDLAGLRLRGQIAEIDTSALRFSAPEALEFLSQSTRTGLAGEDLDRISRFMDGWAMGLQVAAISVSRSGSAAQLIERAAGDDSDLSKFLATDILSVLDEDVRKFLRDTAHLELLVPDLCDACSGQTNSKSMLQELDRLNLFVQSIEDHRGWYRYHHLFRSFLKNHFDAESDPDYRVRHARAYEWFAQNDQPEFAIAHALDAGLWDAARKTVEAIWKQWLTSSRYAQLLGWLDRLPADVLAASPSLQIAVTWAEALQRRLAPARARLAGLIDRFGITDLTLSPDAFATDPIVRDVLVLKGAIDTMLDDSYEIAKLAGVSYDAFKGVDPFSHGLMLNYIVYGRVLAGKFDQADRLAEVALREQIEAGDILVAVHCHLFTGLGRQMIGDLPGAKRAFAKAAELSSAHFSFGYSAPHSMMAAIYYEWGDLTAAARCLEEAKAASVKPSVLDPVIAHYITAANLARARGAISQSLEILAEAERLGRDVGGTRLLVSALSQRVRFLLAGGRLDEALEIEGELIEHAETRRLVSHATWPMSQSLVAQARASIRIHQGDVKAAQGILAPYLVEAANSGRVHAWIKLSILDVLASDAAGKDKTAIRKLSQIIARAAPGRYVQPFLDHLSTRRPLVSTALTRCALDGVEKSHLTNIAEALAIPMVDWAMREDGNDPDQTGLDVVVTSREQDLLRALAAGLSNKNIARDMGISENTVAWHLKNLFLKFGVDNRTSAVNSARKCGLLD